MSDHSFHGEPENPFTELSELRIKVDADRYGNKFSLRASLKMDAMNYDHKGIDFVIGASTAFLHLSFKGLRTVEGTHFGEQRLNDATESKDGVKLSKSGSSANFNLAASNANSPELSGALSTSAGTESQSQQVIKQSRIVLAVKSLPGDRWKIGVPQMSDQKEWISGSAFIDDELCEMAITPVNSSRSAVAQLMVRKLDLEVDTMRGNKAMRRLRVFRNKEAILTQIAAKALKRHSAVNNLAADEKVIVISRHSLEQAP
jgi:hypothetical protein